MTIYDYDYMYDVSTRMHVHVLASKLMTYRPGVTHSSILSDTTCYMYDYM